MAGITRVVKGEIFFDEFKRTTLGPGWVISPYFPENIKVDGEFVHIATENVQMILVDEYTNYVVDVKNGYDPINTDRGGLVIWHNSEAHVEFLEYEDPGVAFDYTYWRVVKEGNRYTFFGRRDAETNWISHGAVTFDGQGQVGLVFMAQEDTVVDINITVNHVAADATGNIQIFKSITQAQNDTLVQGGTWQADVLYIVDVPS